MEYTTCIIGPIAIDDPVAWCVSWSVCLSVVWLRCAKTAKWINVLFGVKTVGDQSQIVLNESSDTFSKI